jgi:hypothetical protein
MDELCLADVGQDGQDDYIWSGYSRFLGYHINLNCLSIPELAKASPFSVYPNPATDRFFVHSTASRPFAVTVCDVFGHVVYKKGGILSDQKLKISHLAAGIYTMQIEAKGETYCEKLVVQ